VVNWYILPHFGIFYKEKFGNPAVVFLFTFKFSEAGFLIDLKIQSSKLAIHEINPTKFAT
jgi:hypothetical protein